MNEATGIDVAERARIRDGLKQYKALHGGIGDTVLRNHIVRALGLPIDLSTLQRFLRGAHRTDDIAVHRYRLFLRRAAPPPAGDELGRALMEFLPLSLSLTPPIRALAGKYRSFTRPYQGNAQALTGSKAVFAMGKKFAAAAQGSKAGFRPGCSSFKLEVSKQRGLLRVTETLKEEELDQNAHVDEPGFGGTGILAQCGEREFFMMTRSYLDARFYLLNKISDAPQVFLGFAFIPQSLFGFAKALSNEPWQPAFEILLACEQGAKFKPEN